MMLWDFGIRIWDCGFSSRRSRCALSIRNHGYPLGATIRNALTLIELLITITILATLATMFLGASNAAMESARAARTKTTINKIHTLLMERWGSYTTRRIDVLPDIPRSIEISFNGSERGQALSDTRLLALRELVQMEMPDRWRDVTQVDIPDSNALSIEPQFPSVLASRPSISSAYLRRFQSLRTGDGTIIRQNQGAECLYMVIMLFTGDGEARTLFSRQDIGDTDEDGASEFLDGWGRPISYLRWPSSFNKSELMSYDAQNDHDPFDPFRRDADGTRGPRADKYQTPKGGINVSARLSGMLPPLRNVNSAFRLVPLIYSSGSDGISDINTVPGGTQGLDPFSTLVAIGLPSDVSNDGEDNSVDNLHNHLQDGR